MQQQLTGQAYLERYGHAWNEPELAREYVERTDRDANQREDGFKIMLGLLPFDPDQAFHVLDVGTGHGAVAALVLDAFPKATAVGLDVSEPMKEIADERMARYGDRFRYVLGDFVDGELPRDLGGPFDVIVSSRAIHHLPTESKQRLYRTLFAVTKPGGGLFNLDSVAPPDDTMRQRYREAGRAIRGQAAAKARTAAAAYRAIITRSSRSTSTYCARRASLRWISSGSAWR
jgi:ubiquinone/menaquinone biosynthesis C-methylase UbiE